MPILEPTTSKPPKIQVMVDNALVSLNERTGSSMRAIKKFIESAYNIDAEKSSKFIKKYVKESLESGKFIQTKGKGLGGSFRLSAAATKDSKKKPKVKATKEKARGKETKPKKEKQAKTAKKVEAEGKVPKPKKTTAPKTDGESKKPAPPKIKIASEKATVAKKTESVVVPAKKQVVPKKKEKATEQLKPLQGPDTAVKNNILKEMNGSAQEKIPKKAAPAKKKIKELTHIDSSTPLKPIVVVEKEVGEENDSNGSEESVDEISEGLDASPLKDDDLSQNSIEPDGELQNEAPTKKKVKKGKKSMAKRKSIATLIKPVKPGKYTKK